VEIKSIDALKAACQRLGFQFMPGQKTYKWYGTFMGDYPLPEGISRSDLGKCFSAIRVPGAEYEVGVVKKADGYTLLYDFWSYGGLQEKLGDNAEKLVQMYAIEAAKEEAQRQGFSVFEEELQDGSVQLHVQVEG
jgi:hypothetical protein